jgi:superfamily II DNA or RNA helicase
VGTFDQLIDKLEADSGVKGHQFERIAKWFLTNDPAYKSLLRCVWLWKEWRDRWSDLEAGIDIVAEDFSGNLWAVQCKAYRADRTITKADIDKFLSESNRPIFTERLLIATTDNIHHVARNTMRAQQKNVAVVGLDALRLTDSYLDWPDSPDDLRPPRPSQPARPYDYQLEAVKDVVEGFGAADRGKLVMACGTGKTLTALFIREKLVAERTLVLMPSLSLLKQTMRVWQTSLGGEPLFKSLPVCWDATVSRAEEDAPVAHTSDLGVPVTTDPAEIAAFLRKRGPRVVFATYQSSPQIAKAFELARVPAFDLVVADEAHRCAGPVSSDFATILDGSKIRARHRLFMTATPRYFTGRVLRAAREEDFEYASMDDEAKFGPEFHKLGFSKAIARKLLTDYQVAIVGVDDATYRDWAERGTLVTLDGVEIKDARTLAGQIGLAKAMRKYDLRRTISFHSRVARAREFADSLTEVVAWMPSRHRPTGILWAGYASGAMSAGQRHILIQHLGQICDGERGLLANARCLAEGVDVPTLDGVAFVDPRRSEIDIVQAVGRAIRKSDDKTVGTIVIPVFIDRETDPETALDSSVFKPVWDVVKALRAHDEELGKQLDALRRELSKTGGRPRLPDKIRVDLPARVGTEFARAFDVRLVERTSASFEAYIAAMEEYIATHPDALVPGIYKTPKGLRLGQWVSNQRAFKLRGQLSRERVERLTNLPGWEWDAREAQWSESYHVLQNFCAEMGRCPQAIERFDGVRIGEWARRQCDWYWDNKISHKRIALLEAVDGWQWTERDQQHTPWTPVEDETVKRIDISMKEIAHLLGRTHSAVSARRAYLGVKYPSGGWTVEEDEIVKRTDLSIKEICQLLGRTPRSVSRRRASLGVTRTWSKWTVEEDEIVKRTDLSAKEIAQQLGRTPSGVENRRKALNFSTGGWTAEEDETVKRIDISIKEICQLLGRSRSAVQQRRSVLGVSTRREWTPEEDETVRRSDISIDEMTELLGRSRAAVRSRRSQLEASYNEAEPHCAGKHSRANGVAGA